MLDYKDNFLLKQLIDSDSIFSIADIQKTLGLSQRSIYYSLERINDFLSRLDLPIILNKRGVGLLVHDKVIEYFKTSDETLKSEYIYTSIERNNLQVLKILLGQNYINIGSLMDDFNVSRSTIIKDLREMRNIVGAYNLTLEFNIERGYEIQGCEIQKRSLILTISSEYTYLIEMQQSDYYNKSDVERLLTLFKEVEERLGIIYVRSTLNQLVMLIAILLRHPRPLVEFEKEDKEVFQNTHEYQVVSEVFKGVIHKDEYVFLVLHLLALRVQYSGNITVSKEDKYITELVGFMINEFYNLTLINFKNKEELQNNLYLHMKPALFRFKYGINYTNELKSQIIKEFAQVYRITKSICKKLERIIDYIISEDEITYIAIHFGALIEKEQQMIAHPKVLLVCLNGKALVRNLRREVESMTKDVVLIEAIRMEDVMNHKDKVDYIISTEPLKSTITKAKTMVVNPILNDRERFNIINFLGLSNVSIYNVDTIDSILKDLEPFIDDTKYEEVRDIIKHHLKR